MSNSPLRVAPQTLRAAPQMPTQRRPGSAKATTGHYGAVRQQQHSPLWMKWTGPLRAVLAGSLRPERYGTATETVTRMGARKSQKRTMRTEGATRMIAAPARPYARFPWHPSRCLASRAGPSPLQANGAQARLQEPAGRVATMARRRKYRRAHDQPRTASGPKSRSQRQAAVRRALGGSNRSCPSSGPPQPPPSSQSNPTTKEGKLLSPQLVL